MSVILAKIFGLYFLAFAFFVFLHPDRMKNLYARISKDENFLFYGAITSLFIGAFIVSVHNIWIWDWTVLITIFGWLGLIKGYMLLIYPESIKFFTFIQNRSNTFYYNIGIIWFILAIFFIYHGWFQ